MPEHAAQKLTGSGSRVNGGAGEAPTVNTANKGSKLMAEVETRDIPLSWDVFVTPGIPIVISDLPPGTKQRLWSPISSTLIYGKRDAVLVDAFITVEQADALADWATSSGKRLTTVYATHAHDDHFFGASKVLERFPGARLVATPDVVKTMRKQASPQSLASFWSPRFPGQIPDGLLIAEELTEYVIDLEGHDLVAVPLGHTDTQNTTCLHVPSIGLVVAGDAASNGVHLYLAESDSQKRREWIATLKKIEALKPRAVIAGHKRPGNEDGLKIIEDTRQYIREFDRMVDTTTTWRELYDKMLDLYPNRANPGSLWGSARAAKG